VRIFQNFGYLSAGKLLGDLFTFFLFVALSRVFGQEGLGYYSFAMAVGGFLLILSDFGLYSYSVKEMSRMQDQLEIYYGKIFTLRLLLSLAVILVLLLILPWIPLSAEMKLILLLLGVQQVLYSLVDGFSAVFVAREEMYLAALLEFSMRAVGALAAIAVIFLGGSLVFSLAMLPLVTLFQVGASYWAVKGRYGSPRLGLSKDFGIHILRETFPFALSRLLGQLATRLDILLLGILIGAAATGVYNAAYRVVFMLMIISFFASLALFPNASRLYVDDRQELARFYQRSMSMIVLAGLPISAGIWLIAPSLVRIIYGSGFAESGIVLRFLAWLVFLSFLNNTLGMFLTACDRQTTRTRIQWIVVWVNGAGNLLLIPLIGLRGAAIVTLFSESLLVILLLLQLKKVLGWPQIGSRVLMSATAVAAFCVPFFFFFDASIFVVVPSSVILYSGVLALFKDIRMNEGRKLISMLHKRSPVRL
jgi:O-antigen/teichoic acid export membrane protein